MPEPSIQEVLMDTHEELMGEIKNLSEGIQALREVPPVVNVQAPEAPIVNVAAPAPTVIDKTVAAPDPLAHEETLAKLDEIASAIRTAPQAPSIQLPDQVKVELSEADKELMKQIRDQANGAGQAGKSPRWLPGGGGMSQIKNIVGDKINPATEETTTSIKTQTDKLTFTGSSLNVTGSATVAGTVTSKMQDGSGNNLASATTTPSGSEQALIVRNIPSGTQTVSGTVTATEAAPSTLVAFLTTVTTAGTRVQLGTNTVVAGVLQAPSTNTGNIYVGGSGVSSSAFGAELQPGQATGIAIDNTNKIWIDSSANGDKCAFLGS